MVMARELSSVTRFPGTNRIVSCAAVQIAIRTIFSYHFERQGAAAGIADSYLSLASGAGTVERSLLMAKSTVRFISETTPGTFRWDTGRVSETALLQTVAPVATRVICAEIATSTLTPAW